MQVSTEKINLIKIPTVPPIDLNKVDIKNETEKYVDDFGQLQNILYAQQKFSLLIILQGMDASGKDGVIKKVFTGINPMGCKVKSFKKPTDEEMAHDFLWRIHANVPQKGMIQIFNRSHYEDVVIQRVHNWIDMETVIKRYDHINSFEKLLSDNETLILKFYLHISKEEQSGRLNERLSNPEKMWKSNPNDFEESKKWDDYMQAYEDAINNCSPEIPWTIVPSDKNWYKEYIVSKTIVDSLKKIKLEYPAGKTAG